MEVTSDATLDENPRVRWWSKHFSLNNVESVSTRSTLMSLPESIDTKLEQNKLNKRNTSNFDLLNELYLNESKHSTDRRSKRFSLDQEQEKNLNSFASKRATLTVDTGITYREKNEVFPQILVSK